jgi:hypothetical protein
MVPQSESRKRKKIALSISPFSFIIVTGEFRLKNAIHSFSFINDKFNFIEPELLSYECLLA